MCFKIRLSARALLEAALQTQEGKQAVKMVKGEGKKRPKGSGAGAGDKELVCEGHSNTETNMNSTSQTASCPALGSPRAPLACTVLYLLRQLVLGQGIRDLGMGWDSPPTSSCSGPPHLQTVSREQPGRWQQGHLHWELLG